MTIALSPQRIARRLTLAVVVMAAMSVIGQVVRRYSTSEDLRALALIFKMSAEGTIPAFFSSVMLLVSAGLLWVIAKDAEQDGRPFARHWRSLALIFLYLSLDEAVGIHELAIEPMRRVLGGYASGFLHYAWVVPGAAAVLAVALLYRRFLAHLPARIRNRMMAAAALYVGGAIGMEMVGGRIASVGGTDTIAYALSALVEETMEMLGLGLFISALLIYLSSRVRELRVALIESPDSFRVATTSVAAPSATPMQPALSSAAPRRTRSVISIGARNGV